MARNPLVSVIIPTHNSEKYVLECVKSVMNQTYINIEIICVDSSVDRTLEILNDLNNNDERIKIIEDANGSYGHKLNVGIAHASGDYVAIVESDDYILPETYEHLLNGIEVEDIDYIKSTGTNHFADVDSRRVFCPENNENLEKYANQIIDLTQDREIAFVGLPRIWTALYRRDFLREKGIVANETPGASFQDTSFTLLVAILAQKCIYKQGAFYCYRNDNQGSSVKSKNKVFCVCDEYKHIENVLSKQNLWTDSNRERIMRYKLATYIWNLYRLDKDIAEEFVMGIASEMKEYPNSVLDACTQGEKNLYHTLVNIVKMRDVLKQREKTLYQWEELLREKGERKYVLISAGNIGKTVLWLQEFRGKDFVLEIADNNYMVLTDKITGYTVKSVEDVVSVYPNEKYLIANKNHCEELTEQLKGLGIKTEQIKSLGYLSRVEIFNIFNEYF